MSMFSINSSKRHAGLHRGFFEGIKIHDHHVDVLDAVFRHLRLVLRVGANGQQSAVDLGMKGLYPAVEHLRESRQIRDVPHLQALLAEEFRRAARGEQLDAERRQARCQFNNAGLVASKTNGTK